LGAKTEVVERAFCPVRGAYHHHEHDRHSSHHHGHGHG
jgi:urease accessory protein